MSRIPPLLLLLGLLWPLILANDKFVFKPTHEFDSGLFWHSRNDGRARIFPDPANWTYIREPRPTIGRRSVDSPLPEIEPPSDPFMNPKFESELVEAFLRLDVEHETEEFEMAQRQMDHKRSARYYYWGAPNPSDISFEDYEFPDKMVLHLGVVYDKWAVIASEKLGYNNPANFVKDIITGVQQNFQLPSLTTKVEILLDKEPVFEPAAFFGFFSDAFRISFSRAVQKHLQTQPSCRSDGKITIDHTLFLSGASPTSHITGLTPQDALNLCSTAYPLNHRKLSIVESHGSYVETVHAVTQHLGFALGMKYDFSNDTDLLPVFDPEGNNCTALNSFQNWFQDFSKPLVWSGCSVHNFKYNMWMYQRLSNDDSCLQQDSTVSGESCRNAYGHYWYCRNAKRQGACDVDHVDHMLMQRRCRRRCGFCTPSYWWRR